MGEAASSGLPHRQSTENEWPRRKSGSEQKSVKHPSFIGFPWLGPSGPTKVRRHWDESSPMFAGLSTRPWNPLPPRPESDRFSSFPESRRREPRSQTHNRSTAAPAQPERLLLEARDPGAPKPPQRLRQIKGCAHHQFGYPSRIHGFKAPETALLSSFLPPIVGPGPESWVPEVPGRAKCSTLRQLPVSPNSRAEPRMERLIHRCVTRYC